MDAEEVRKRLRRAVELVGGNRAFAVLHGLPSGRVSEVLNGKREPPQSICRALALERVVVYQRLRRQ